MSRLMIALVSSAFAAVAVGQTAAPAPDAKAAETKAKQEMVNKATATPGAGVKAAEGSAAAAKTKDAPKALPDTAAKQKAVKGVAAQTSKGAGASAAEGSAKAAADKTPRKAPPKQQGLDQPELKKAIP